MNINEIMHDFRRRYEQSYVWVESPEGGEESLFFVDRIADDQTKVGTIELSSPEFGKILLNMGTAHTLKFKYPPVGVFQNGVDAYIFRRVPAKQYKHGIYNGNSSVQPVYTTMLGRAGADSRARRNEQLKFHDVLSAFRGDRYSFADALKMLSNGKYRSVALQRNWSLCLSPLADKGLILLYWETPVASLDQEGNVLNVYEKVFDSVLSQVKEA